MIIYISRRERYVPLAQPDRVFGYEPKGRGFESLMPRQKKAHICLPDKCVLFSTKSAFVGINPLSWMKSLRDEILLRKVKGGGFNFI